MNCSAAVDPSSIVDPDWKISFSSISILFCRISDKAFTATGEFTVPRALINLILDSPLTSKDSEIDELLGLKLGADDFIKKSGGFSVKVLIERIRVQLRKKNVRNIEETKNIINHGKLKLDPSQLECEWDGKQLPDKLTTTEFLIVQELAKRPGIIKERSQLMDIAYREDTDIEDRTIDSHVKRIRKKFKKVDNNFSAIETRYGSGYRWNVS